MKSFVKLTLAASIAVVSAADGSAQNFGESCGCPPLSSRTAVTLNNASSPALVNSSNEFIGTVNLTCDNIYTANTKLYVTSGNDLNIQPGTVIKWADNAGINANALIVTRGAQIFADGTESCPIIMTSTADPLDGSYAVTNRGKWGGLIILGNAFANVQSTDQKDANGTVGSSTSITGTNGVGLIEGLASGDARHFYGQPVGSEVNTDNSGILRHVSLRHGGELLGTANEINGLTMGGVGSGTIIEYVEVTSNLDDAFEWFGGSVNCKYLVAMHCDDDYIDYDQGYTGKIQFFYGLQGPDNSGGALNQGDNGMECDGDDGPGNSAAKTNPTIYNATIINRGITDEGIEARREANGTIANSIFANAARGLNMSTDVTTRWNANTFNVKNCTFQNAVTGIRVNGTTIPAGGSAEFIKFFTTDQNTTVADGSLIDASFAISPLTSNTVTNRVNPVPAFGQAATTLSPPADGFFTNAKYRGAFEPGAESWLPRYAVASRIGSDKGVFTCVGDLNGDFIVNATDFSIFAGRFGNNCN
jgi:hypothetical protein